MNKIDFHTKTYRKLVLLGLLLFSFISLQAQIQVSGSNSANSITANSVSPIAPGLTISSSADITNFTVSIIDSYSSGDQLSYPSGTLPSGITVIPWSTTTRSIVFKGTATVAEWQTFLKTVTIISGSVCTPETRKVSFAAGETYYSPLNGHFYRLTTTQSSWTNSQNTASSTSYYGREGYMVTLTSSAENTFVSRLVGENSWMGASDDYLQINNALGYTLFSNQSEAEGKFFWVTGPEKGTQLTTNNGNGNNIPNVYQNWRNGEPNNSGSEHYGHVYSASEDWNDFRDTQTIYGIMEFGDMPNDITVSAPQFTKDIFIQGSSSGSISGGNVTVCKGTNSTTLTLNGLTGTVVRWESSTNNFITAGTQIANTTTNLNVTNISETIYYRAIVNATAPSTCSGLITSSTPVFVSEPNAGNVFAENTTICAGSDVELYVSGQEGTVQKWQRSTDNTNWVDIINTTTTLTETIANIGTVYYRVQVEVTGCGAPVTSSSKEITVVSGTAPTGGQVSSEIETSTTNNGTLTLTGYTGTITKWQKSTDNGIIWSDISNTATTYNYNNIASETLFRAQLTNGSCGSTFSDKGTVTILAPPSISTFTPNLAGNGDVVTITGSGFTGTTTVAFGTTNATSFTIVSDTEITATVGSGSSGTITVINPAGNDTATGFIYKVAQYDFENNPNDETDNNYDGTEINTVTYETGAQGQAVCFDDGPGYVSLPDNLIRNLSEFTISLRFKTTGTGAILGYQNIAPLGNATNWIPILMLTDDGKLKGTLWTTNGSLQAISTNPVNDGNWHQVDLTASSNTVTIYLDGSVEASTTGSTVNHIDMSINQLGLAKTDGYNNIATTWEYFDGCLDDMVIIDKALTAQELEDATALPEPTIASFTPNNVGEEDTVVITGTNFDGATQVTFGGVDVSSYTVDSATQITAVIATGATGDVNVITAGGTATANGFTFTSKTVITTSVASLSSIIYCGGEISSALDFEISANDVYQDLVITAPTGFEVSSTSTNTGFASSVTLSPVANTIDNSTIYLRVAANQPGRISGNISLTSGAVTESVAVAAETNNSLSFDGIDDYVDLAGNSLQDGITAFTIEAWILPDNSNYDGNYHAIFGRQSNGTPNLRNPSFYIIDGKIHVDSYEDNTDLRFDILTDEALIAQNVWSHIALVKEGTVFTVYVNGIAEFTTPAPNAVHMAGPYQIGFIDNYFAGKIDDVRFWNVSRTATEITNNIDTALTGNEPGLVGYYTFNEGIAEGSNTGLTTLVDGSPSGNNGTLLNMSLTGSSSNWVQGYFSQISGDNSVATGTQLQLSHLESGGVWSSNNTNIATVNQSGLVTGVALGTVEISYALCGQTTVKIIEVNNPPGFTVSETALTMDENAGTNTFTVVLNSEPVSDVMLDIASNFTAEVTVSEAQLTFTAANWNVAQTITVTGINDDIDRDDSATITISVNDAGSDDSFDALVDQNVAITLTDDDIDSDGDGILDPSDNCQTISNSDQLDTDNNGDGDVCDDDDDGDGTLDVDDDFPLDENENTDTDGDGTGDNADDDDDNDGTPDTEDDFPLDENENTDTDGDGTGDNADDDDDNDGTPDTEDDFPLDENENTDTDSDGTGDNADLDDDNDGTLDVDDNFPLDENEDTDTDDDGTGDNADDDDDNDGTPDIKDDFPLDENENTDTDGDGTGNNEDDDDDNDGTPDTEDDFPLDENENTDTDGDGTGNNEDGDIDGDGIPNEEDAFPNNSEGDMDNDGIPDEEDAFPEDPTESTDNDGDGIGDNADTDDDNDGYSDEIEEAEGTDSNSSDALPEDNDNDGIPDSTDEDDDNDGIVDQNDNFPNDKKPTLQPAEAFTPNGDGINDTWVVPGINNYPNALVKVYNRWGHEVFAAVNYRNDWRGNANSNGELLPAGSYLYIIDLSNGSKSIQGWIFINY